MLHKLVYGEFGDEDDESDELYVEESGGNSLVDDMEDDSLLLDSELEKIDSNFEDSDHEYNSDEENKKSKFFAVPFFRFETVYNKRH